MQNSYLSVQFEPLKDSETAVALKLKDNDPRNNRVIESNSIISPLIEYLGSKKDYDRVYKILEKAMEDCLPPDVGERCKKCKPHLFDKKDLPSDLNVTILGNCDFYKSQMWTTFMLATREFVAIIRKNWFINENILLRRRMTQEFLQCFMTIKGKGILLFHLPKLRQKLLEAGFLSASQAFEKADALQNLGIINETINSIDQSIVRNEIYGLEDVSRFDLQKKFFVNKRDFYKEKLWIQERSPIKRVIPNTGPRPNRSDIAYFCYYTTESKELITKEPIPSKAGWEEIGKKFSKSSTNIEKKYNEILVTSERIKSGRYKIIQYVLDNMLQEYPKASNLAKEELKRAKLK